MKYFYFNAYHRKVFIYIGYSLNLKKKYKINVRIPVVFFSKLFCNFSIFLCYIKNNILHFQHINNKKYKWKFLLRFFVKNV